MEPAVTDPIAEIEVVFVYPDGREVDGRIAIGKPVQEPERAGCPIEIVGLTTPVGSVYGADTMQALVAALQHIAWELHAFIEHGGRILDPDGDDANVGSIFGRLFAPTPDVPDDER